MAAEQKLAEGRIRAAGGAAVGRITINRAEKRNAMSLSMWAGLAEAVSSLVADTAVRVIVLRGAGEQAFVAGADIAEFEAVRADATAIAAYEAATDAADRTLFDCPKPTIALIHGFCVGGGLGIALNCDLRLCSDAARFGIPAARMGIGYGAEAVARLVEAVGAAAAAEILFSARLLDAHEAQAFGLVNRVMPTNDLDSAVQDLAEGIAANAPLSVAAAKAAIRAARDPSTGGADVSALIAMCSESDDYIEGRRAFVEKRAPVFRGV